ncbi:MAG: hypothetical protein AAGB31_12990 [Bdellovibrio sp.]
MEKHTNYKIEQIVSYIAEKLDCSQKLIASYTSLNESTISANLNKEIEVVGNKKAGRRLLALYLAIHQVEGQGSEAIKEALNEFVYEDLDGNFDSVVSAIGTDKYQPSVIANIASIGMQKYKEKMSLRGQGLFEAVKSVVASSY